MRYLRFLSVLLLFWCLVVFLSPDVLALNMDKLKRLFLQGDYNSAIEEGERLLAEISAGDPDLDKLYYFLGLSYLKAENYLRASDIFEIILEEFPDTKLKEQVRLGLADSYFLRGDFSRASSYYQDILDKNPNTKYKELLYYRISQAGVKDGDTQTAKKYIEKMQTELPPDQDSILRKEIKEEVFSLPERKTGIYSVQVGSFSKSINADNLTKRLVKEGYSAYSQEAIVSGGAKTYRVKVGDFSSLKEVKDLAEELARKGYPTKICP